MTSLGYSFPSGIHQTTLPWCFAWDKLLVPTQNRSSLDSVDDIISARFTPYTLGLHSSHRHELWAHDSSLDSVPPVLGPCYIPLEPASHSGLPPP